MFSDSPLTLFTPTLTQGKERGLLRIPFREHLGRLLLVPRAALKFTQPLILATFTRTAILDQLLSGLKQVFKMVAGLRWLVRPMA